ncbi:MAG: hypothetical protein JSS81_16950 [Acidobacteria bacterium]|nr:hypothetical protein [Acidobacteriota bacterium]
MSGISDFGSLLLKGLAVKRNRKIADWSAGILAGNAAPAVSNAAIPRYFLVMKSIFALSRSGRQGCPRSSHEVSDSIFSVKNDRLAVVKFLLTVMIADYGLVLQ